MPTLSLPDGDGLYYETHGAGPPLLLVAGLGGVATFWDPVVPAFAERFTVVLHDHRGTGRSSLAQIDYSVDQMAADVLHLLDHLGIERAHYVGHSTGGAIGQTLALDRPERIDRLVLSATWPAAAPYFRLLFRSRAEALRHGGPGAYARSSALFLRPPWRVRDHPAEADIGDADAARQIPDPEILLRRADLPRVAHPMLVIGARDDAVTPAYFSEDIGRLIPNAETVILPRGGHFFPVIRADAFRRIVVEFLTRSVSR